MLEQFFEISVKQMQRVFLMMLLLVPQLDGRVRVLSSPTPWRLSIFALELRLTLECLLSRHGSIITGLIMGGLQFLFRSLRSSARLKSLSKEVEEQNHH